VRHPEFAAQVQRRFDDRVRLGAFKPLPLTGGL
jgi:hypothetical protein